MDEKAKGSIREVIDKNTALLRFLFDRYKDSIKVANPLQSHKLNEKLITIAELIRLYREHNMDHGMLNKLEFEKMT